MFLPLTTFVSYIWDTVSLMHMISYAYKPRNAINWFITLFTDRSNKFIPTRCVCVDGYFVLKGQRSSVSRQLKARKSEVQWVQSPEVASVIGLFYYRSILRRIHMTYGCQDIWDKPTIPDHVARSPGLLLQPTIFNSQSWLKFWISPQSLESVL